MAFQCIIVITMASQVVSIVLLICIISGVDASSDVSCNDICEFTAWALDANCRDRGLTQVPPQCNSSEMVDLRNNELTYLRGGSFAGYRALRYLDLEFNTISNIARGAFDECISLQHIYLQFNSLVEVGERVFEGATDMKKLFLNQNSIIDVHPDAFGGLGRLIGLYIGQNKITRLPTSVFQHTPNLEYLHMGDNGLTELPTGIFDNLIELVYLNVENNKIQSLDGSIFKGLVNLEELKLSVNLIHQITDFPTLPSLGILDLFANQLTDIGVLADKLDGLEKLYLAENNDVECTCSVDPIREWVRRHITDEDIDILRVNLTCGSPAKFRGTPLNRLTRKSLCPVTYGFPGFAPAVPADVSTPSTKAESGQQILKTDLAFSPTHQNRKQNSYLNPVILYLLAGIAILISAIAALIVLTKYSNRRSHRNQQNGKQQPTQQQQQQLQQSLPLVHIIPNRVIQDDEGHYERVSIRPHSPSDSAFGSQDDVLAAQVREAESLSGPTYRVPPCGSDAPHNTQYPTSYMTLEQCKALYPTFTGAPPPLEREQQSTNPFRTNTHDHMTKPYISHEIYNQRRNNQTQQQSRDGVDFPGQTPERLAGHTPHHMNPKHPRCSTENPFRNSNTSNPFTNCV